MLRVLFSREYTYSSLSGFQREEDATSNPNLISNPTMSDTVLIASWATSSASVFDNCGAHAPSSPFPPENFESFLSIIFLISL